MVRYLVADAIGEIVGSLLMDIDDISQSDWPNFIPFLFQLYGLGTAEAIDGTLRVLATVFSFTSD